MIDRRRLAMVLGMLGSSQDGEVVAAARAAERLRTEAGLTWVQILDAPEASEIAEMVELLVTNISRLNPWGRDFVRSIAGWNPDHLSAKQRAVVERLVRALRARRAA